VNRQTFLEVFGHVVDTPGGIDKLRSLVLDLAVHGRLTRHDPTDEPASELLKEIAVERDRMVKAKEIRKPKTLPSLPADDPPFLPKGWACLRFGDLFSRMGAGSTPPGGEKSYVKEGVIFLRSQNVYNSGLVLEGVARIPEATHEKMSGTKVRGGDILLNITGASIGRAAIVPRDGWTTANVNQHVSVLRPLVPETTKYLHLMMTSPYFQLLIAGSSPGASREGLAIKRMQLFPVPLPPIAEQHRIVDRTGELMGLCDELEEQQSARAEARSTLTATTLNRVTVADSAADLRAAVATFADNIGLHLAPGEGDVAALKRVRQTILDIAVRGRLTHRGLNDVPAADLIRRIAVERDRLVKEKEIRKPKPLALIDSGVQQFDVPEGWEWSALGRLVLFSDSGWSPVCLPTVRSDELQWAVLKVSAVSWGKFRSDEHKLLTPGLTPRPQIEVQDGDFLMSRANTASLVGRSVVVADPPPRLMLSDKHVRLKFFDRATAEFVNLVNATSSARDYYASVATGTSDSMRNINRDQILALPIPVPPLEEQRRIVDAVAHLSSLCDKLEQQLLAAKALRQDLGASVAAHATLTD
jgi:type I restriction enzyme S subunit